MAEARANVRAKVKEARAPNKGGPPSTLEKAMLEGAGADDKVSHQMRRGQAPQARHTNPDEAVAELLADEFGIGGDDDAEVADDQPEVAADGDDGPGDEPAEEAAPEEEAGEEVDEAAAPDGEAGDDEYLSIRDLAEATGLDPAEVYGAVIDMGKDADGNRRVLSIGEIKDQLRDTEEVRQRQQQFDEESRQFELDKDNNLRHLMTLANELQRMSGGRISSEVMDQLREADSHHERRQEAALLNFVPEWRNSKTRVTEQAEVFDWWQSRYGFTKAEIEQIGKRDARAMRAMRDFALGSIKADAALKRAGKPKAEPSKSTRTKRSVLARRGSRSQRIDDRDAQAETVSKLLGSIR